MSERQLAPLTRGLGDLAQQINEGHDETRKLAVTALQRAMETGALLLRAKQRLPHGEWGAWMRDNIRMSPRTAQMYMRVARTWPQVEGKSASIADLTLTEVVAQLTEPTSTDAAPAEISPPPPPALAASPTPAPAFVRPSSAPPPAAERHPAPRSEFIPADPDRPFDEQISEAQSVLLENLREQVGEYLAQPGHESEAAEVVALLRHLTEQVHGGEIDAAWFLKLHSIEGAAA